MGNKIFQQISITTQDRISLWFLFPNPPLLHQIYSCEAASLADLQKGEKATSSQKLFLGSVLQKFSPEIFINSLKKTPMIESLFNHFEGFQLWLWFSYVSSRSAFYMQYMPFAQILSKTIDCISSCFVTHFCLRKKQ